MLLLPDLDTRAAGQDRDDEIADVEARVQDIERLEHDVEAVAVRGRGAGAEDAQHEEDDAEFGEAGC